MNSPSNQQPPSWVDMDKTDDVIVRTEIKGNRVVAIGQSGRKYVIGYLEDVWPMWGTVPEDWTKPLPEAKPST